MAIRNSTRPLEAVNKAYVAFRPASHSFRGGLECETDAFWRKELLAATSGLPGRRRDFLVQCQAKARRCQRRTVSGRTISRHRRQPDQNRYNTTHKSRSHRWRRKRRGAFFWQTASWWRSARISVCRAARVRKLEATKAKRAIMISRMVGTPAFSDRQSLRYAQAVDWGIREVRDS